MSKRTQKLLAVVLGSALVFSACGSDTGEAKPAATTAAPAAAATTAAPAPTPAEAVTVGLVFDIGGRGDGGFNDSAYIGLERGQNELGASISDASPNSDGSNRAELLRLQADDSDLVVGVGFLFADTMTEVAAEYPDTKFGIIDGWVEAPNVASLGFAEHEGSFLVGAAAGLKTESDTIGFIGGVSIDLIGKFEAGFIAGVTATNPDANVLSEYISEPPDFSGFNAPDRGREIALAMFEKGADIVYHAAGGSGAGLFEAAKSFSEESGSKVWAIGVDQDQYTTADEAVREYILTSMLKRVDVAVFNTIKAVAEGNFVAGGQSFDLSVDGVGYSTAGGFIDDIVGELEDLKAKIVSGAISVPTTPGERAVVLPDLGGRVITIAVDNAYLPFAYIPADTGVAMGWDYDAMDEVCARINCVPSFQEFVWDGTIIATGEGQFDMAGGGITITEERDKVVDFSISFISTDQKILIQKDNAEIGSRADLEASDCNVGSMTGTTNYDLSVDVVGEARIVAFESFAFAVQALISGDVCAVIMDDVAGQGYQGENADQVSMIDEVLTSDPLGWAFTEGSDLVAPFNAALQSMKDDGTLAALNASYFGTAFSITYDDIGDGAYAAPPIAYDFGVTEDVIRVGAIADLSGVFAPLVIQIVDAQTAYWDMVNEAGGIAGRQVEFLVLDSAYDVPTHLERYEVMRDEDEGVVFLSQSTGSPHTAAIAEALVEDGLGAIPLSWYSGWPDPDFGQNVFESYTNYCYEAINGVDFMANNLIDGEGKLAVISLPGEYGQDGAAGAKIAAEALGIEVVYDGEGTVIPGADQTPVISGLLESGANMVWTTLTPGTFAEIFGGAGAQGFAAQWSGNSPTYNYMLLATPLAPLLDAYYTQSGYTLTWNAGDAPGMVDMVAELQARIPDKPLSDVYAVGWTEAMATHQILETAAAAGDLTRAGVIAAANTTTVDYGGLAPSQSYGGEPNDYIVRESFMFDIQADLFDVAATVAGGGSTGSVLLGGGPIVSDITNDQTYEGACFVAG